MTTSPMTVVVADLVFAESLRWHNGRLWFSDMYGGQVRSWSSTSGHTIACEIDGRPSGLGWTPDGELLVASMDDRLLLRVAATGRVEAIADLSGYTPHPINDMVIDCEGRAFIGATGYDFDGGGEARPGFILRVDTDGTHAVAATEVTSPNGMVLTDGGQTLIVAETLNGRLIAFAVAEDGSLGEHRIWASLPSGVLPDGICLHPDGSMWVASPTTAECLRIAIGGVILDRVELGDVMAISCVIGGSTASTLYVASCPLLPPSELVRQRVGRILAAELTC